MKKPLLLGHRGYPAKFGENTLNSFKKALRAGAHGIECDIQKTKDGKFAVIHDDSVDRVCDRIGWIRNMTLREVKTCRLKNNETIPELEELLALLPYGAFLDLELKAETISPVDCPFIYRLLRKYGRTDRLLVSSFDFSLLKYFKEKKVPIGFLFGGNIRKTGIFHSFRCALNFDPEYYCVPVQALRWPFSLAVWPVILFLKLIRRKIAFWAVNDTEDLLKIIKIADVIITNDPKKIGGIFLKNNLE